MGREASSRGDTRQRILDVAARLFTEKGYAATSVRDIAKALGIANPSLYYHFKSKAEILDAVLLRSTESIQAELMASSTLEGEARVRKIIEALIDAVRFGSALAGQTLGIPEEHAQRARQARPAIEALLGDTVPVEHRTLRLTMTMGAVESAIRTLMTDSADADDFAARLDAQREPIVELALGLLLRA